MVEVITPEIRQQAQEQSRLLAQQQSTLQQRQKQLQSATSVRQLGRIQRQTQFSQLGQAIKDVGLSKQEVERVSKLPTAEEVTRNAQQEFQQKVQQARKLGLKKNIPLSSIDDKFVRKLAQQIREGVSSDAVVASFEKSLGQSLPLETRQQLVTQFKQGSIPSFESQSIPTTQVQIPMQQSLTQTLKPTEIKNIETPLKGKELLNVQKLFTRRQEVIQASQLQKQLGGTQRVFGTIRSAGASASTPLIQTLGFTQATGRTVKRFVTDPVTGTRKAIEVSEETAKTLAKAGRTFKDDPVTTSLLLGAGATSLVQRGGNSFISTAATRPEAIPGRLIGELATIGTGNIALRTGAKGVKGLSEILSTERIAKNLPKLDTILSEGKKITEQFNPIEVRVPLRQLTKQIVTKPQEVKLKFNIDESKIENYLKKEFNKRGGDFNAISKVDKDFLIGQVKARIRNQPELFLNPAVKKAIKNAKVNNLRDFTKGRLEGKFDPVVKIPKGTRLNVIMEELPDARGLAIKRLSDNLERESKGRVKSALNKGPEPIKAFDLLSKGEKERMKLQIEAQIRANPRLGLTQAQKDAIEFATTKSELRRIRESINKGSDDILRKDLIPKVDKDFREAQITANARSQQLLLERGKLINRIHKPILEIKPAALNEQQKILLSRLRKATQEVKRTKSQPQALRLLEKIGEPRKAFSVPRPEALQLLEQVTRQKAKQEFKQLQMQAQKEIKKMSQLQATRKIMFKKLESDIIKERSKLKNIPLSALVLRTQARAKLAQLTNQAQRVNQAFRFGETQLQSFSSGIAQPQQFKFASAFAQPQVQRPRQAFRSKTLFKQRSKLVTIIKMPEPFSNSKEKLKTKSKSEPGYFALIKQIKTKGFVKINKKPLTKEQARDLLFYGLDKGLETTGRLKPTKKRVNSITEYNIPRGYSRATAFKFREYRIVNGRRVPTKNQFIEKQGRPRLDMRSEVNKINAFKVLANRKRSFFKPVKPLIGRRKR